MSWVAAGKTLPGSADSLGIILGHNAPFPTPLPSCWGMNMHPVIEVRRQLEPVTWQVSPGPVSITARHSLLRVVCDLERTWSWKARKRAQILDPALPPGVDVILSILCVCVWIFLNPRSQNKEQKKKKEEFSPSFVCHSPWQLSFQASKCNAITSQKQAAQLCVGSDDYSPERAQLPVRDD